MSTVPGIGLGGAIGAGLVDAADQYKTSQRFYRDDARQQKRLDWQDQAYQDQLDTDAAQHDMDGDEFRRLVQTLDPNHNPIRQLHDYHQQSRAAVDPNYQPQQGQGAHGADPAAPPPAGGVDPDSLGAAPTTDALRMAQPDVPRGLRPPARPVQKAALNLAEPEGGGSPTAMSAIDMDSMNDQLQLGRPMLMAGGQQGNYLDRSAARAAMRGAFQAVHEPKVAPGANPAALAPAVPASPKISPVPPGAPVAKGAAAPKGAQQPVTSPGSLSPGGKVQDYSKVSGDAQAFDLDNIDSQLGGLSDQYDKLTDEIRAKASQIANVQNPRVRGSLYSRMLQQYKPQLQAMEDQARQLNANYQTGLQRQAFGHVLQSALAGDNDGVRDYMGRVGLPAPMVNGFKGVQTDYDSKGNPTGSSFVFQDPKGGEHRIDLRLFQGVFDPDATPEQRGKAMQDALKRQGEVEKAMVNAQAKFEAQQARAALAKWKLQFGGGAGATAAMRNAQAYADTMTAQFKKQNPDASPEVVDNYRMSRYTEHLGIQVVREQDRMQPTQTSTDVDYGTVPDGQGGTKSVVKKKTVTKSPKGAAKPDVDGADF